MHVLSWVAAAHHVLMHEEADKLGPGKVKKRRPACLSHEASRSWPARHATKGGSLRKKVTGCPRWRWRLCDADCKPRKNLPRAARATESKSTVPMQQR